MIWLGVGALTAAVMALLLWPLLRPRAPRPGDAALAVYRDQLAELERARASGTLEADAADAARAEIGRRMLAADAAPAATPRRELFGPVTLAVGLPLLAVSLYVAVGAPELVGRDPAAPRDPAAELARLPPAERQQAIRGMVESFAQRMESQPADIEGWRRLGRMWGVLGEPARARAALTRARALAPDDVGILSDYARSFAPELVEGRPLPPDFVATMRRILELDENDADAMWFIGLVELGAGNRARAVALWERLLSRLPPDSDQARVVRERLERVRAER